MSPTVGIRRARWRTWLRERTPTFVYYCLGLAIPKAPDCGDHDRYKADDAAEHCYHCQAERPRAISARTNTVGDA